MQVATGALAPLSAYRQASPIKPVAPLPAPTARPLPEDVILLTPAAKTQLTKPIASNQPAPLTAPLPKPIAANQPARLDDAASSAAALPARAAFTARATAAYAKNNNLADALLAQQPAPVEGKAQLYRSLLG